MRWILRIIPIYMYTCIFASMDEFYLDVDSIDELCLFVFSFFQIRARITEDTDCPWIQSFFFPNFSNSFIRLKFSSIH